ncbi:unnamed protein product [Sphenostylis stenocarpa]|uniref:Uncharacterized protein n=1 Tax=Sphenostylis stenocarpa TaxID=92480 RepID=A0AA86SGG5_9FABA|nr:unnamed protein product [Sphenostylis stenocarpa]
MQVRKPHAVLTPFPVQGHISSLFRLAKLLHLRGFCITFVHTEYNYKCLLNSRSLKALDGIPDFHFETIPNGLPPNDDDDVDVTQDVVALCKSVIETFFLPFRELLARLYDSAIADIIPPVTCLVSDLSMTFTTQSAHELALPIVLFSPATTCSLMTTLHYRELYDKGLIPLKGVTVFPPFSLKTYWEFSTFKNPTVGAEGSW